MNPEAAPDRAVGARLDQVRPSRRVAVNEARRIWPHPAHTVCVWSPVTCPLKDVNIQIADSDIDGSVVILPVSHAGEQERSIGGSVYCGFSAGVPANVAESQVITRFAYRRGVYCSFLHQARRFRDGTDWITAAREISAWVRTGPNRTSGLISPSEE